MIDLDSPSRPLQFELVIRHSARAEQIGEAVGDTLSQGQILAFASQQTVILVSSIFELW